MCFGLMHTRMILIIFFFVFKSVYTKSATLSEFVKA